MHRFLHSSDLHIGRSFGQFPPDLSARLHEARYAVITTLGTMARNHAAPLIVLAGDTWDVEVPSDQVLRQSLDIMAGFAEVRWAILPGNHDLIGPGGLWDRVTAATVPNVTVLSNEAPLELSPGLWALPSPCRSKDPGRDVTIWMNTAETPDGAIRLGIAHGPIQSFADAPSDSVIDPRRAEQAGLDFLSLGDWHGWLASGPRTLYAGTPEPDRFRNNAGFAALVQIDGPRAVPDVQQLSTGRFQWIRHDVDIALQEAPPKALGALLPDGAVPRDTLLSIALTGTATLPVQAAWRSALEALEPSLAALSTDFSLLSTLIEAEDLDVIDRQGALRDTAEALRVAATDDAIDKPERDAAALALNLLYSWSVEGDEPPADAP